MRNAGNEACDGIAVLVEVTLLRFVRGPANEIESTG